MPTSSTRSRKRLTSLANHADAALNPRCPTSPPKRPLRPGCGCRYVRSLGRAALTAAQRRCCFDFCSCSRLTCCPRPSPLCPPPNSCSRRVQAGRCWGCGGSGSGARCCQGAAMSKLRPAQQNDGFRLTIRATTSTIQMMPTELVVNGRQTRRPSHDTMRLYTVQ